MPRCLQLSRPHIFWQIGCEAFTTDAHIAKIISAKLPLWPARGTWQAPFHASLYQTKYFQDNANYDKFHHPALCAFPANLPNSRESGRVSWFQLRGMLSDWMMLKPQPYTAVISPFPAATTSSLLSFHILTLVCWSGEYRSTNNLVKKKKKIHLHQSRMLLGNPPVTVTNEANACVWTTVCICNMQARALVWYISRAWAKANPATKWRHAASPQKGKKKKKVCAFANSVHGLAGHLLLVVQHS